MPKTKTLEELRALVEAKADASTRSNVAQFMGELIQMADKMFGAGKNFDQKLKSLERTMNTAAKSGDPDLKKGQKAISKWAKANEAWIDSFSETVEAMNALEK